MTEFDIDFRYPYGTKGGGRSSSISVSDELKCALDDAVGEGNRSAFMERASWLLLALMQKNASAIESWHEWAEKNIDITLIEDSMLYFVYGDEYKLP
jgi:hypothetical protein